MLCYCANVKNVTVSVPDDVYRQARIRAAERDTSVSALVADYLRSLSGSSPEFIRLRDLQRTITDDLSDFSATDRLGREELHERGIGALR
jgi:plasmid stability protein